MDDKGSSLPARNGVKILARFLAHFYVAGIEEPFTVQLHV